MNAQDLIAQTQIFKDMKLADAEMFLKNAKEVNFASGRTLFEADERGETMYILLSGQVKVTRMMKNKEMILGILGPESFCGEMSLVDDGLRSATATAIEDTATLALSRKEFEEFRSQSPSLYLYLLDSIIKVICLHLRQANQTMEVIRFWLT